jgi:oxygen-independent coproporphyrinogen-3 oxidase
VERIMLETRLVEGLPVGVLDDHGLAWLPDLAEGGLVEQREEHVVLTRRGRLLADAVVRDLVP